MEQVSRKVTIHWKYNPTTFETLNKDVVGESFRKIGSSISAVNKILGYPDMLRQLMPQILGISPDSRDTNWDKSIRYYWDSLSVDISSGGKILETGFEFDINDLSRKSFIKELVSDKSIKTDSQLANLVMNDVPEEERWKYGNPINVEDYLLWRYILNYKHVANNVQDINKSPNIRFYLHTQEEREKFKKEQFKTKQAALTEYMKFMEKASEEDINDILALLTPDSITDIVRKNDIEEKQMKIMEIVNSDPNKFVNTIKDKNAKHKSLIEKYIAFGILKKLPSSTVVVESADPSVILGNNMDEVVSFISNEKNKVKVNELLAKYKSLITT